LVLSGVARFLIEFLRRNPKVLWHLSNAQLASLLSVVAGLVLILIAAAHRGQEPAIEPSAEA
jgi:phosphatidylglycerol:prolipoprotein diacylglycerol transferase